MFPSPTLMLKDAILTCLHAEDNAQVLSKHNSTIIIDPSVYKFHIYITSSYSKISRNTIAERMSAALRNRKRSPIYTKVASARDKTISVKPATTQKHTTKKKQLLLDINWKCPRISIGVMKHQDLTTTSSRFNDAI